MRNGISFLAFILCASVNSFGFVSTFNLNTEDIKEIEKYTQNCAKGGSPAVKASERAELEKYFKSEKSLDVEVGPCAVPHNSDDRAQLKVFTKVKSGEDFSELRLTLKKDKNSNNKFVIVAAEEKKNSKSNCRAPASVQGPSSQKICSYVVVDQDKVWPIMADRH